MTFITGLEIFPRLINRHKHTCPSCRTGYNTPKIQKARGFVIVKCPTCKAELKRVKLQRAKR